MGYLWGREGGKTRTPETCSHVDVTNETCRVTMKLVHIKDDMYRCDHIILHINMI